MPPILLTMLCDSCKDVVFLLLTFGAFQEKAARLLAKSGLYLFAVGPDVGLAPRGLQSLRSGQPSSSLSVAARTWRDFFIMCLTYVCPQSPACAYSPRLIPPTHMLLLSDFFSWVSLSISEGLACPRRQKRHYHMTKSFSASCLWALILGQMACYLPIGIETNPSDHLALILLLLLRTYSWL